MKTMYKYILSAIFMLMAGQTLQAQEAFYIYRNDGDFDGFFFDEVKSMGYSKFDLDSIEHDVYVVQEIELEDTIYRIPLAAIDSIGFQQPDIILNPNLIDLDESGMIYNVDANSFTHEKGMQLTFSFSSFYEHVEPKVGNVLVSSNKQHFGENLMIGKVTRTEEFLDNWHARHLRVYMDSITNIGDVFEQFISVEQIGFDADGQVESRVAGLNKIKRRVSGNRDLTLVSINGTVGASWEPKKNMKFSLGVNLGLSKTAQVVYNIGWTQGIFMKLTTNDDFEASFSASGDFQTDGNDNLWEETIAGGAPVMFPSFLPLFEIRPIPGCFLRAEGHITATLTSPKLALNTKTTITINTKNPWRSIVSANVKSENKTHDKDNKWNFGVSLNGFVQVGIKVPLRIFTCSWARELLEMSVGADLLIGPKLTANFNFDTGGLADGIYETLKDSKIELSALSIDHKTGVTFTGPDPTNFGEKFTETFDVLEGGIDLMKLSFKLFPDFDETEYQESEFVKYLKQIVIHPRGLATPCNIGWVAFDETGKMTHGDFGEQSGVSSSYGPWDNYPDYSYTIILPWGKYTVCPAINLMRTVIPIRSEAKVMEGYFGGGELTYPISFWNYGKLGTENVDYHDEYNIFNLGPASQCSVKVIEQPSFVNITAQAPKMLDYPKPTDAIPERYRDTEYGFLISMSEGDFEDALALYKKGAKEYFNGENYDHDRYNAATGEGTKYYYWPERVIVGSMIKLEVSNGSKTKTVEWPVVVHFEDFHDVFGSRYKDNWRELYNNGN